MLNSLRTRSSSAGTSTKRGRIQSTVLQDDNDTKVFIPEGDFDCRYRSAINRPRYGTMKQGNGERVILGSLNSVGNVAHCLTAGCTHTTSDALAPSGRDPRSSSASSECGTTRPAGWMQEVVQWIENLDYMADYVDADDDRGPDSPLVAHFSSSG